MPRCCCWLVCGLLAGTAAADDWPNFQGPTRDGRWNEPGIVKELPPGGPKIVWRKPVLGGYAGPAVAAGRVFVHDFDPKGKAFSKDSFEPPNVEGEERVFCFDAATGAELWKHAYSAKYTISYACGPRCTPTVHQGRVYTLGTQGKLLCLDAKTGQPVWQKDLAEAYGAPVQTWGFAAHPLADGDTLYCVVGGPGSAVVAFDAATGKERWKALDAEKPGYCGPTLAVLNGKRMLLAYLANGVHALDPATGKASWHVPLKASYDMAIIPPIVRGDDLLAVAYDKTGAMVNLAGPKPQVVWQPDGATNAWLFPVNVPPALDGGVLYGADSDGMFRACEWPTGKRLWQSVAPTIGERRGNNRKNGTVFFAKNGDRYYMLAETGELLIAKLSPEKYEEISRHQLIDPTGDSWKRKVLWSPPAFANGGIYVRNDLEIIFASLKAD